MKGNNNKHPLIKAGLTAAAVLGMMHAANRMIFYFAEQKSKARADRFYDWKYGRIHYTKTGSGSPVLLVHRLETGGNLQWRGLTVPTAPPRSRQRSGRCQRWPTLRWPLPPSSCGFPRTTRMSCSRRCRP